ncbi:alpha/beta fold hydrolase [Mycobacterium sp. 852002-10029_SCH5224772]|uniref:alpha/beta fold hydrolase n=1 Tax=Mycobacterium sp. 852002-10029_SCH5224772 TaxID=1834083 RepID=UPI0007FBFBF6|nr:alpha/beta hydrolase [Mycobacterium sp. 852002-10029_SCH5224772]OBF11113.1 alpha/beta hydrolase [Mycobacterium sp. 852002-10029_SCH5224772]
MTVFALLHGGLHYGSCWDAVRTELWRRDHRAVAPDLPVDDDSAGALEWAQVAIDAIEREADGASEDVVVVAHSISGLCAPVIATLYPVRHMVFVGGLLPVPGQSFVEHLGANPDAITFPEPQEHGDGPFGLGWESVREGFYHDCPEALARHAFDELRYQSFTVFTQRCPINRWPDTASTYVLMRDDRAVGESWARRNAVARIGAQVVELDGGHSPFFSRPAELSGVLLSLGDSDIDGNCGRGDEF